MSELDSFIGRLRSTLSVHPRISSSSPTRDVRAASLESYVAIAVEITVIAFLIVFAFVDIYITRPSILSTRVHVLYPTGTTIVATVIASFVLG
jgi:hypothetical protein